MLSFIIKNHFLYAACSFIYFLLGASLLSGLFNSLNSYIISFNIYVVSVMIALSPLAEKMLRFFHGIRSIETNEEREQLMPILDDVINTMSQGNCFLKRTFEKIEIGVIDKLDVNACAVGRKTIAVTKGAMKAFDEEQLKGIIAHEMAHIVAGDTVANMFLLVASGYFYLFVFLFKLIVLSMDKVKTKIKEKSIGSFLCSIIRTTSNIFVSLFSLLSKIVLALESRKREYRADKTAYEWNLGEELISALYLLEKISLGDNRDWKQKLTASHPRTTARIGRLEGMIESN
jgi:heat shock protein HtpX